MSDSIGSVRIACIATIILSASSLGARPIGTDHLGNTNAARLVADEACSLLTKEDAAAALGEAVKGPNSKTIADQPGGARGTVSYCEYTGSGYHRIQLDLTRLPQSTAPTFRAMCKEKATKDLTGLGDMACWYNEKHEELHALKGMAFLSVEINRSGDPTEAIKGVMKKALERLK